MSVRWTNRFWPVSLEYTLFLDCLKLFVNMRLVVSFAGKKNAFFGPTDQKLWMFEVSRRSLGRAGMCWSQPARIDHLRKKWRAGKKKFKKNENRPTGAGVRGSTHVPVRLFQFFLIKKKRIFGSLGNGLGLLRE
jgi:hypothetical protein